MSNYIGIGKQSHQQRFINAGDNSCYNKSYLQSPQTDRSGSHSTKQNTSLTPKRNNLNEKSKIGGGQPIYGQANQRGGNSTHEVSHGWKDGLGVSPNVTPSNSSNEFYTSKSTAKSYQPQRQEPKVQMLSSQRPSYQQDQQINYLASSQLGGQQRNNANMTPRKYSGLEKTQAEKSMESSLERSRGVQRYGELTSRKSRKTGHNENINDTNQEILNKLKQLSNSPISHSFHTNITPANKTFNSQLKQGINSKIDYSAYGQAVQGVMNYSSKTPKSARNIPEQTGLNTSNLQQHQTQLLRGYETDRMKRSITPTEGGNGSTTSTPNVKLQEMLNRVQQLTSNLKSGSSLSNAYQHQTHITPPSDSSYNLERRLTPTHQAASDGFSTRSDVFKKHPSNQPSPGIIPQQQYVPLQQQIMSAMNSSKSPVMNNTAHINYPQYLEQQQQQNQLDQSQTSRSLAQQKQAVQQTSQPRDTSQKQSSQRVTAGSPISAKTTSNKGMNSNIKNSSQITNNKQSDSASYNQQTIHNPQQKQQFAQNKTSNNNNDLDANKQAQKQFLSNKPQQKQQATPTFTQLSSSKQLNSYGNALNNTQKLNYPQNQYQNFSGKSNQNNNNANSNNTEEANTTSSSGNTYGNISQSPSHNSNSQNDLSQENSQKKSPSQDAALLRLLQEKLGDQYSYLLAGKQIELETPRNNQTSMKASDIQREQSARTATPSSQHCGLIKQQSTPTIFSQSPQQSQKDNQLDNQTNQKQQQGQFQQTGQISHQDAGLQMAWLRQQQQQLQQEEAKNPYAAGVSSPSVNMYYPQFAEYSDFPESQENQQNLSSNQLPNNPSYDFSGNLTNSQYFNHNISLNNHNLCSSPDLNQSNSQYICSSPDLNNSTQNALFNPYMINNFMQSKANSQSIPFDSIKNNPANLLYLQQLQQYQEQLQLFQAQQQQYPNRSGFIQNPNQIANNSMNMMNQQSHLIETSLIQQQQQQQFQQPQISQDHLLLQSQRIQKEESHSINDNNLQEECISSSTSSTNTPVTVQINTQISNNEQQLLEKQSTAPDSVTLQRIVKVCTRAEECIYELLQSREFEHQSHFLVKYHLLLPDLPLLQKLPISSTEMKEIQRAINMQILLVQVIVYEHIVVLKQLRESVRGAISMNENLQNILNSFQYVHSSLILILIIFEQAIQNIKDQGDTSASSASVDISTLSTTIRERTKKRKMGFLLKNSDKLAMLKKFNDILQPLLQILIEGQIELKEEKQTDNTSNSAYDIKDSSFYDKLLEIQDQIPSMQIGSMIQIAEQLSKDNIQLVQDEADRLALIHERKAVATSKESFHGDNQIRSEDSNDKDENKLIHFDTDSPERSLKKQPTFKAQSQNEIPAAQDEENNEESSTKQIEKERTNKAEDIQQKGTQETQQIPSQELSICGTVNPPYLKDASQKKYTLVLDLDETLVHYQELEDGGQFLVRPYAETFLEEMSEYYEIIIFTAALQDYADFILDIIDVKKSISHRFYRQHTTFEDNFYVKDLSRIGRNLDKTLIIDNLPENFKFQPENGIQIQSWYGEPEDRALYELTPLLKQIVKKRFKKVQTAFSQFREKTIENISKGIQDPHLNLSLDPLPEDLDD